MFSIIIFFIDSKYNSGKVKDKEIDIYTIGAFMDFIGFYSTVALFGL